jgi:hypothetical protein
MFRIFADTSEVQRQLRVVDSAGAAVHATYENHPFKNECSGFVVSTDAAADFIEVKETDHLQVVKILLITPEWYESHRSLGWFDDAGRLWVIVKSVTDERFSFCRVSELLDFDFRTIGDGRRKVLSAKFDCTQCDSSDDVIRLISDEMDCSAAALQD